MWCIWKHLTPSFAFYVRWRGVDCIRHSHPLTWTISFLSLCMNAFPCPSPVFLLCCTSFVMTKLRRRGLTSRASFHGRLSMSLVRKLIKTAQFFLRCQGMNCHDDVFKLMYLITLCWQLEEFFCANCMLEFVITQFPFLFCRCVSLRRKCDYVSAERFDVATPVSKRL